MAHGIDWFRWHHGTVADQKFILVARRAGGSVAEVIAVWACLLEAASASDDRGNFGAVDYEALDCALGMPDGRAQAIHEAMASRGVVTPSGDVSAWGKRQPKRERDDDKSTERVRAFRQKQRNETPGNATERQETPREEKSREEETENLLPRVPSERDTGEREGEFEPDLIPEGHAPTLYGSISRAIRQAGIGNASPSGLRFRALVDAGATADEFIGFVPKALSIQGDRFAYIVGAVEGERKRAASLAGQLHRGQMQSKAQARVAEWYGSAAKPRGEIIDMEAQDGAAVAIR